MKTIKFLGIVVVLVATCPMAHATLMLQSDCPGGDYVCKDLPAEAGPEKFRTDAAGNKYDMSWTPVWTDLPDTFGFDAGADIIGESFTDYDPDMEDPSSWDDTFVYYLHIDKYRQYYEYDRFFHARNNSCIVEASATQKRTYTQTYSWTASTTIQTALEAMVGVEAIGQIKSTTSVSDTFSQSWTEQIIEEDEVTVSIPCCTVMGKWNQYKMTEIVFDIGIQRDHTGYWGAEDEVGLWVAEKELLGLDIESISGECVPEPATVLLLGLGSLALVRRRRGKGVKREM